MPKVPIRIQRTLTVEEVGKLIRGCEMPVKRGVRNDLAFATAVRNAAIVTLMFDSLLRASELVALEVADIDLECLTVTVRAAKNGRARVALFGPDTAVALRA